MLTIIETPIFLRVLEGHYNRLAHGEVVLVAVYAKAKFDNMPVGVLKSWKEAYDV